MKTSIIFGTFAIFGALAMNSCTDKFADKNTENGAEAVENEAKGGIVYVDVDRILKEYDMANDLTSVVNAKAESLEQELTRRGAKIERDAQSFQEKVNKGLLTQSVAEVQYRKIQEDQAKFQEYAATRQREMQEQMVVTQNQILNAISTFIKTYNETAGYAMILATQGDNLSVPVVCATEGRDITDDIVEGLNKEYVKTKNNPGDAAETESK